MYAQDPKIQKAINWLQLPNGEGYLSSDEHCSTRDVFQARLDRLTYELQRVVALKDVYTLLVAIVGELGNNSFDHNIGSWSDAKGVYFTYDLERRFIVVADRGQGVLATLQRVRPKLGSESEAIRVAFTEVVSGRSPEQRGNGLKFVEAQTRKHGFKVYFYSGDGMFVVNNGLKEGEGLALHGVLAVLSF